MFVYPQTNYGASYPYHEQLTEVQKRRAEGRTRKGVVDGRSVHFQKLNKQCTVNVVWDAFWTTHYTNKLEAQKAAEHYEKTGIILAKDGSPIVGKA